MGTLKQISGSMVVLVLFLGIGSSPFAQVVPGKIFVPGNILVAHKTTSGSHVISKLNFAGNVVRQFGTESSDEFRAHLALAGGFLFRSNGTYLNTIDQFDSAGTLVRTITPNTSATHQIVPIAADFANRSIYMVDTFAGTNDIYLLDDPSTGASNAFTVFEYPGVAGISDLYFGGPRRSRALYALAQTSPFNVPGTYRVVKIDANGGVQFFDNAEFTVPFTFDVGSVAVDAVRGDLYVATTTKIVRLDAGGNSLGSFNFSDSKPSLDVDFTGNILVGAFDTGQISVFSPNGVLQRTISIPGATSIIDLLVVPRKR